MWHTQFAAINPNPIICCARPTINPRIFGGAISVYSGSVKSYTPLPLMLTLYSGTAIDKIPIATPATIRPIKRQAIFGAPACIAHPHNAQTHPTWMVRFRPNLSLALGVSWISAQVDVLLCETTYHPAPSAPKKQPPVNVETTAPVKAFDGLLKCALNLSYVNTEDMIPLRISVYQWYHQDVE